jgi:hypothetical protein
MKGLELEDVDVDLSGLGVPSNLMFSAAYKDTALKLLKLTAGKAFDVVLTNSLGDIDEQLVAPLRRFVRIGQGSIPSNGRKQNTIITLVDFESVARSRPSIIKE